MSKDEKMFRKEVAEYDRMLRRSKRENEDPETTNKRKRVDSLRREIYQLGRFDSEEVDDISEKVDVMLADVENSW